MTFHKIACTHIHIITIIYRNVGSVIKVQKKFVLDGRGKAGDRHKKQFLGAEVGQWTHHTQGQLTVSTQHPQHIFIYFVLHF